MISVTFLNLWRDFCSDLQERSYSDTTCGHQQNLSYTKLAIRTNGRRLSITNINTELTLLRFLLTATMKKLKIILVAKFWIILFGIQLLYCCLWLSSARLKSQTVWQAVCLLWPAFATCGLWLDDLVWQITSRLSINMQSCRAFELSPAPAEIFQGGQNPLNWEKLTFWRAEGANETLCVFFSTLEYDFKVS